MGALRVCRQPSLYGQISRAHSNAAVAQRLLHPTGQMGGCRGRLFYLHLYPCTSATLGTRHRVQSGSSSRLWAALTSSAG